MPRELLMLGYIDRFGVRAVMGRDTLGAGEIRRMIVAENITEAWKSRDRYRDKDGVANWSEWAGKHPQLNSILTTAERLANGE
jgi:hypothetical protein